LITKVMLGLAMFPVVLRSDNAAEFVGEVVAEMNKLLEIRHVTGSAYHPQSQGTVESMHKTLNHLVRGLCQNTLRIGKDDCHMQKVFYGVRL
jgi:DMSO reductase anchor subunit